MNDPWKLISADEARRHLLAVPPVSGVERVPLRAAAGRVLAEPLPLTVCDLMVLLVCSPGSA